MRLYTQQINDTERIIISKITPFQLGQSTMGSYSGWELPQSASSPYSRKSPQLKSVIHLYEHQIKTSWFGVSYWKTIKTQRHSLTPGLVPNFTANIVKLMTPVQKVSINEIVLL